MVCYLYQTRYHLVNVNKSQGAEGCHQRQRRGNHCDLEEWLNPVRIKSREERTLSGWPDTRIGQGVCRYSRPTSLTPSFNPARLAPTCHDAAAPFCGHS